jgi:ubiquinone/menaquinone biosynthesis C-methylase UbiE
MRRAAETQLAAYPKFHSIDASAEATTLPNHSIDLVIAAQAFHWFHPTAARAECLRILKKPGHAALLWNTRKTKGSPFLEAYEQLLLKLDTDYQKVRQENITPAHLKEFFASQNYHTAKLPNAQHLNAQALRGRLESSSYTPSPNHPGYQETLTAVDQIFHRHQQNNTVTLEYQTEIYWRQLT